MKPRRPAAAAARRKPGIIRRCLDLLDLVSAKPCIIGLFLLCALPAGLMMAMITPPGQVPDEPAHMTRAAGLLGGAIMGVRKSEIDPISGKPVMVAGVKADTGLVAAALAHIESANGTHTVTLADYDAMRNQPPDHVRAFFNIPNTVTYFPAAYTPAALGLAAGLLFKASPFVCLMLARFSMLAAFLLLGGLALWVTAYGEALLLAVLLMPMTLFLAGSLNEDGVLIGMACLSAAAFTRDQARYLRLRLLAILLLVMILASKPPYLPLLGMALLPLRAPGFWSRAGQMVLAGVPVLVWVFLVAAYVAVPFGRPAYHPGPLFAGDARVWLTATNPAANLAALLADPVRLVIMPWQMFVFWQVALYQSMIGILGLLAVVFPGRYYVAWTYALAAALLGLLFARRQGAESRPVGLLDRVLVATLLVATCWAISIALYLTWSNVGSSTIVGVQGRYFLLILPFAALAAPAWRRLAVLPAIVPALPVLVLGIYDLGYVPFKLVTFFYMG
jgi:hypothetical protein